MKTGIWLASLAVIVLMGVLGYWYGGAHHFIGEKSGASGTPPVMLEAVSPCTLDESGCRYVLDGGSFRVWVQGTVRPLQPFEMWLEDPGIVEAEVRFVMEGMDMGLNLFRFEAAGPELWHARSVLPVCTVDRSDWTAVLTVSIRDDRYRAVIPFTAR